MYIEINQKEKQILVDLVESRMRELHPTIRRCRVSTVTDELKLDLKEIEQLLEKLQVPTTDDEPEYSV